MHELVFLATEFLLTLCGLVHLPCNYSFDQGLLQINALSTTPLVPSCLADADAAPSAGAALPARKYSPSACVQLLQASY